MEESTGGRLIAVFHEFRRIRPFLPHLEGISHGEFYVMHTIELAQNSGTRISEIGRRTRMSRPALSQVLSALEDRGLVRRIQENADRRGYNVVLTPQGRLLYAQSMDSFRQMLDEMIRRFGEENAQELISLATRLFDVMNQVAAEKSAAARSMEADEAARGGQEAAPARGNPACAAPPAEKREKGDTEFHA